MSVIFLKNCELYKDIEGAAYKILQAHLNYPAGLKYANALFSGENTELYYMYETCKQYAYTLLSGLDTSVNVLNTNNDKLSRIRNSFL